MPRYVLIFAWLMNLTLVSTLAHGTEVQAPIYPAEKVGHLLKKVEGEKKLCEKEAAKKISKKCRNRKLILAMEALLKSYITLKGRVDKLDGKIVDLDNENSNLKHELKDLRTPASFSEPGLCFKKQLRAQMMISGGIPEDGSAIFTKKPTPGGNGVCWSNSKKKKEGSINLCEYPLALDLDTRGGPKTTFIHRQKEYLFSLNGCDLMSVHILDDERGHKRETFISYDQCMEQWNKRTADASMTPSQVKFMEDIIGVCFRESLLPPRNEKNGRENPETRLPAQSPSAQTSPKPE